MRYAALWLLVAAIALAACEQDPAHKAFMRVLKSAEDGSTMEQRLSYIDQAIALAPDRGGYYKTRASLLLTLCRTEEAIANMDRAIELADHPYFRYLRGIMLSRVSQYDAAIDDFDRAIAEQPSNSQFYRGRSLARAGLGDGAGALADAERLISQGGLAGHFVYARGIAHAASGQHELAVADFDAALEARPELQYVFPARAASCQALGRHRRAAADREVVDRNSKMYGDCGPGISPYHY